MLEESDEDIVEAHPSRGIVALSPIPDDPSPGRVHYERQRSRWRRILRTALPLQVCFSQLQAEDFHKYILFFLLRKPIFNIIHVNDASIIKTNPHMINIISLYDFCRLCLCYFLVQHVLYHIVMTKVVASCSIILREALTRH